MIGKRKNLKKYIKWLVVVLALTWVVALLQVNYHNLNQEITVNLIGLLTKPLIGVLAPAWVVLLFTFTAGFALAIILDVVAWYEYNRMIRLQRRQIVGLQDALDQARGRDKPVAGP